MFLSKQNLLIIKSLIKDKKNDLLNALHILKNGSTFAVSQSSIIGVEPLSKEIKSRVKFIEESHISNDIIIDSETTETVLKNLSKDESIIDINEKTITINNGATDKKISFKQKQIKPLPYMKVIKNNITSKHVARTVVNLSRLKSLLESIEKISGDSSGELPIYIEFSEKNSIIIRCNSPLYNQRILGMITAYKMETESWIESTQWEMELKNNLTKSKPKFIFKKK